MGFTNEVACRQALIQANNDVTKAIEILVGSGSTDRLPTTGGQPAAGASGGSAPAAAKPQTADDLLLLGDLTLDEPPAPQMGYDSSMWGRRRGTAKFLCKRAGLAIVVGCMES